MVRPDMQAVPGERRTQRHPVIQTAPRTVNERSGELREFGAVGVYCSNEIKALGRDYVPFFSFSNSVGRRKAV